MIPEGKYVGKALAAQWLPARENGNRQVAVTFAVEGQPDQITWYGSTTEKTIETTILSLEACGVDITDAAALNALTGIGTNRVGLVIVPKPFVDPEGRDGVRNEVRWVNPLGARGGTDTADDPGLVARMAAIGKSLAKTTKAPAAPKEPAPWEE